MSQTTIKAKCVDMYNLSNDETAKFTSNVLNFADEIMMQVLGNDKYMDYVNRPELAAVPAISSMEAYESSEWYTVVNTASRHYLTNGQLVSISATVTAYSGVYNIQLIPDDTGTTEDGYVTTQFLIHKQFTVTSTATYVDLYRQKLELVHACALATLLFPFLKRLNIDYVAQDFQQYGEGSVTPARTNELRRLHDLFWYEAQKVLQTLDPDFKPDYQRRGFVECL